jgi:hypothetical protein
MTASAKVGALYIILYIIIVVSDDVGHSSMLASVELKKHKNHDDIDFLQMNGYVPCVIQC